MHIGGDALQVAQVAWWHEHESGEEAAAAGSGECAPASRSCGLDLGQANTAGESRGKFAGAEQKCPCVLMAQRRHGLLERRARAALGFSRSVQG